MNKDFLRGEFPQHAGRTLADLMANCKPMQTQTVERADLLDKTKDLRRPTETLLSFMGRTGLSQSQIFNWKVPRLREWIDMLARNAVEGHADAPEPHTIFAEVKSNPGENHGRETELDFSTACEPTGDSSAAC